MKETRHAKLTKRTVDAAQHESDRYIVWDTALPGFGLLVLPSGVRSYFYNYRNANGVARRITIGKASAIPPDQARSLAEGHSATVKAGGDPLACKTERREALTVSDLLDKYLASSRFLSEKVESTRKTDKGRIEHHLRPLLGKKIAAELTPDDVRGAFQKIADGKTKRKPTKTGARAVSHVRGGEGAARKSIVLLAAIYAWAISEGKKVDKRIQENPCTHVKVGSDGEREIYFEDKHYKALFETLDTMERERRLRPVIADLFRLYAITGARRKELLELRWRHVVGGNLVFPPGEHKGGKMSGKAKTIALPAIGQEIIARQPAGGPDDFVFRPAKGEGHIVPEKSWRKVRQAAGLPNYADGSPCGFHGLRHSVGSHLAMDGAEGPQIMAALGHTRMSTTTRYIHFAERVKSTLAERAAAPALAGMAAAAGAPKAAVLPLKGKGHG